MTQMRTGQGVKYGAYVAVAFVFILVGILGIGGMGKNDAQNWQMIQSVTGNLDVRGAPGWYLRKFATVTTYPLAMQKEYNAVEGLDPATSPGNSIRITFNDGGNAWIDSTIRVATPRTSEAREKMHREFGGDINNVMGAVRSHMINCAKTTAPLMSASEHQSARKSEFRQLVQEQLMSGLYEMRKVEKIMSDETDVTGKEVRVFATEIVLNTDGTPKIAQRSPLEEYNLEVLQFSVTRTEYDKKTKEKFATKKDSFLRGEQAKADREQEVQQRLMIEEKGLRQKAEVEAIANVERAQAVINAEREKEVAELNAARGVAVAEQTKLEAEMKASQIVEVARLDLEEAKLKTLAADERAQAIKLMAAAEEERIAKGGAITEKDERLAQINAQRDVEVARELAKIPVPHVVIGGGGEGGQGMTMDLVNMALLKANGLLDVSKAANSTSTGSGN